MSCRKTQDLESQELGNFKKIPEMFGTDGEYPPGHPEGKL